MGFLMYCGTCCTCLSIWAMIQLSLMGCFYYIESPILIEDVEAHEADGFRDFVNKTRHNYYETAWHCWTTAALYTLTLVLSVTCIKAAQRKEQRKQKILGNDALACVTVMPNEPTLPTFMEKWTPVKGKKQKKSSSPEKLKSQSMESSGKKSKSKSRDWSKYLENLRKIEEKRLKKLEKKESARKLKQKESAKKLEKKESKKSMKKDSPKSDKGKK